MDKIRTFLSTIALIGSSQLQQAQSQEHSVSTFSLSSSAPEIRMETVNGAKIALLPSFDDKRKILLFIPTEYESQANDYLKHLSTDDSALAERDLKIFAIAAANSTLQKEAYCKNITVVSKCEPMPTSILSNKDSGPLFILIGKDRNIKLREQNFVSEKALFGIIDAMPMRQKEKKRETTR